MISKRESKNYKKIIGKNYTNKVLDFFKEKGYTRSSGKSYIVQDIVNIMNGTREDMSLEFYILEVVEHYQLLADQLEHRKNELTKKPEAATSGL